MENNLINDQELEQNKKEDCLGYQNSQPGCSEEVEIKDYIHLQLEEGKSLRLHYLVDAPSQSALLIPPTSCS